MPYKFYTEPRAKDISYEKRPRPISDIEWIVVHFTANYFDKAVNNATYFATSNKEKAGAHFFIDNTSVYQSIAPTKVARAVGGKKYKNCDKTGGGKLYKKCTNANSVSVELCSEYGAFSAKTLDNAEAFIKDLMKKWDIPSSHVIRHFDVNGKQCPGWQGWWGTDSSKWWAFKKRFM